LLAGFAGACLAFLRYNFYPAKIFLGDAGSTFLGLTLAALSLSTSSKGPALAAIGVPLLAAGIPVFDTMLAVWRRSARILLPGSGPSNGSSRNIVQADAEHLHHRLMEKGLSPRKVAVSLYGISAVLGAVGLVSMMFHSRAMGIFLVAFVLGTYVVLRHLAWIELWDSGVAVLQGLGRPTWRNRAVIMYPIWDVAVLGIALAVSVALADFYLDAGISVKKVWIRTAPLSLGLPFLMLVLVRAYSRVWSLARISEFVLAGLAVSGGIVLGLGILVVLDDRNAGWAVLQSVFYLALAVPGVVGSRTAFRLIQDLMAWKARFGGSGTAQSRILVYGAGYVSTLFFKDSASATSGQGGNLVVMGLIDEDPYLRGRLVHGYRVLGGIAEMGAHVRALRVGEIWIAGELAEKTRTKLLEKSGELGLKVVQWHTRADVLSS